MHPYVLGYIDDHIFRGNTRLECLYVHVMYIFVCNYLRVKLKAIKTVLVAQQMITLRFQIDLTPQQRTIDIEKYEQTNLQKFLDSETHTTHQGQQLAGQMEYVAPLKWPLKCYIRALHIAIPHTLNPHTT